MMNLPDRPQPSDKVTIEDLLRLKRAERPAPEFWTRFEQDLRVKQLAAIIEPRPWWIRFRLPQASRALARLQVPIGAAAVLALSFVVIREYKPGTYQSVAVPAPVAEIAAPVVVGEVGQDVARIEVSHAERPDASSLGSVVTSEVRDVAVETVAEPVLVSGVPGELMAMIPWAAPGRSDMGESGQAARHPLGELPQVHFASDIKPAREHRFEGNVELASLVVSGPAPVVEDAADAIASVSPVSPREVRRNRILASLVVADNATDAGVSGINATRDVAASTLDSDRLYDSVRRVGMGGDRLTLRF